MHLSRRDFVAAGIAAAGMATESVRASSPAEAQAMTPDTAAIHPDAPTLIVRDLPRVADYYEDSIGLASIDRDGDTARLGAGGRTLLVLRKRNDAEREPLGLAGLYHTAFLVPSRADLGVWLRRAIKKRTVFDGAADHLVSEALYLSDPEGNGIEVYADRPRSGWAWKDGIVEMRNSQLDGEGILAAGAASPDAEKIAARTIVGHVHLRVGGIPEAEKFYRDLVGLDVTRRRAGATFYAADGYHHHLATNTWESEGSGRRSGRTTGLAVLSLIARDEAKFETLAERLIAAGGKRRGDSVTTDDPWGNQVVVSRKTAS